MRRTRVPAGTPAASRLALALLALTLPVLALPAAVAAVAGCGSATLNAYDVRLQGASVRSTAAEAALLARAAARGPAAARLVHVHASELARSADSAAHELAAAQASPELRVRVRSLARISAGAAAQLRRLAAAPDDPAVARSVQLRCARFAALAKELGAP